MLRWNTSSPTAFGPYFVWPMFTVSIFSARFC